MTWRHGAWVWIILVVGAFAVSFEARAQRRHRRAAPRSLPSASASRAHFDLARAAYRALFDLSEQPGDANHALRDWDQRWAAPLRAAQALEEMHCVTSGLARGANPSRCDQQAIQALLCSPVDETLSARRRALAEVGQTSFLSDGARGWRGAYYGRVHLDRHLALAAEAERRQAAGMVCDDLPPLSQLERELGGGNVWLSAAGALRVPDDATAASPGPASDTASPCRGRWEGTGQNGGSTWSITMDVEREVGPRCGAIEYPSLGCGGPLTNGRRDGDAVEWTEVYDHNRGRCAPPGRVRALCRGDEMIWTWTGSETVNTVLRRVNTP